MKFALGARCVAMVLAVAAASCEQAASAKPPSSQSSTTASAAPVANLAAPITLVTATVPPSEVTSWIASQVAAAQRAGHSVVVYVGAEWCEPCTYFKKAVKSGELDAALPGLRVLDFDHDQYGEALAAVGYASEMIPLFVVPDAQGKPTRKGIQGSVKGPGAVADLTPRLQALLAK